MCLRALRIGLPHDTYLLFLAYEAYEGLIKD